jgi:hypothetical protein
MKGQKKERGKSIEEYVLAAMANPASETTISTDERGIN